MGGSGTGLASGVWAWLWRGVRAPHSLEGYGRQPLTGFYQAVWPIGASALLVASRPALWPVGAAFFLWEARFIRRRPRPLSTFSTNVLA